MQQIQSEQHSSKLSGLRPIAELGISKPHGNRLRYMAGCRCDECRASNTAYARARAAAQKEGDWNGLVSAAPARQHLASLSNNGVGRGAVADCTDVAESIITKIANGTRTQIRARTAKRILAVTTKMAADGAYIPAKPTWKLIRELQAAGIPKCRIAKELHPGAQQLQLGRRRITARSAYLVEQAHARLLSSDEVLVSTRDSAAKLTTLLDNDFTQVYLAKKLDVSDLRLFAKPMVKKAEALKLAHLYEALMS